MMLSRTVFQRSLKSTNRFHSQSPAHNLNHALPLRSLRFLSNVVDPPKRQLYEWYTKEYGDACLNESSFQFEEHFREGESWWTARFICPKTQEIYEAGTLLDEEFYDIWSWSKGDRRIPIQVDDKFYYRRIKTALHAAAGRRLDAIHLENALNKQKFCSEDHTVQMQSPVTTNIASGSIKNDDKEENRKSNLEGIALVDKAVGSIKKNTNSGEALVLPDMENAKISPKAALHDYYNKIERLVSSEMFKPVEHPQEKVGNLATSWWSTSFVCPQSGREYTSGSLLDEETFGEVRYLKGRPYYHRKKSALHAAAAVALDDIYFQLTGTKEPRLCGEDPSLVGSVYEHANNLNRQLTETSESSKSIVLPHFRNNCIQHDQNSPEDLSFRSSRTSQSNTLQRVMEAWSDSFASGETHKSDQSSLLRLRSPIEERKRILNDAKLWVEKLQPGEMGSPRFTLFHNYLQVTSLASCNAILSTLAKANAIRNGRDVQEIADHVFNFLWSCSKPNTETYNSYMQCLHGEPSTVAEITYEILLDMIAGKIVTNKKRIPSPDIETFHTVMKIWAKTGDVDRCQSLSNLMEHQNINSDQYTFEILLSSFAHGRFDQDRVLNLIEDIEDKKLLCNAAYFYPLRWGGKRCVTGTIPWDCSRDVVDREFREIPNQDDVKEAEHIEKWVQFIDESPDLELSIGCYEAVIQAWLRTGTLHGLEKAELWAGRSLTNASGTLQPRLQTFLPILAVLVYLDKGSHRINEWSTKLEELSKQYPQLRPDGRVKAMILLSWRLYQESLHEDYDLDKAEAAARESSNELDSMCEDLVNYHSLGKGNLIFIETATFCDVMRCLESFAKKKVIQGNKNEAEAAVTSIINIASKFRKVTNKLKSALLQRDDSVVKAFKGCNDDSTELQLQLRHLIHRSPDLYVTVTSSLLKIEQARNSSAPASEKICEDDYLTMLYLIEAEGILRNFNVMHKLLPEIGGALAGYEPHYQDSFPYHGESDTYRATKIELCAKIVSMIAMLDKKQYLGDKIRVLKLVLKVIAENQLEPYEKAQVSSLYLHVIKVLKCIEGKEGRDLLTLFIQVISEEGENRIGPTELNQLIKSANKSPVAAKPMKKANARSKSRYSKSKSKKVKLNQRSRLRMA
mmetsp:Transcript_8947/g.13887  ORF Transcript_8947/g.13887 Transcript_8947/m.13887 type:complete len:1135 (+) Transcript_8947:237-3641(+)